MSALEEIMQMRRNGQNESDIINSLRGRYSPKEINDAISQARIKDAISNEEAMDAPMPQGYEQTPQIQEEEYSPAQNTYSAQQPQEYYPSEEGYAPQGGGYASYQGSGTDTMIEVAEQVIEQKLQKIKRQIDELNEFRTIAQTRIEMNSEKLKRIENILDKLQIAIIDKVGSYQNTLNSIKDEMNMMQDSFSKVANRKTKRK